MHRYSFWCTLPRPVRVKARTQQKYPWIRSVALTTMFTQLFYQHAGAVREASSPRTEDASPAGNTRVDTSIWRTEVAAFGIKTRSSWRSRQAENHASRQSREPGNNASLSAAVIYYLISEECLLFWPRIARLGLVSNLIFFVASGEKWYLVSICIKRYLLPCDRVAREMRVFAVSTQFPRNSPRH